MKPLNCILQGPNVRFLPETDRVPTDPAVIGPHLPQTLTSSRSLVTASMSLYVLVIWPTLSAHRTARDGKGGEIANCRERDVCERLTQLTPQTVTSGIRSALSSPSPGSASSDAEL